MSQPSTLTPPLSSPYCSYRHKNMYLIMLLPCLKAFSDFPCLSLEPGFLALFSDAPSRPSLCCLVTCLQLTGPYVPQTAVFLGASGLHTSCSLLPQRMSPSSWPSVLSGNATSSGKPQTDVTYGLRMPRVEGLLSRDAFTPVSLPVNWKL